MKKNPNTISIQFLGLWCDADFYIDDGERPDPHTGYPGCDPFIDLVRLVHKGEEFDLGELPDGVVEGLIEEKLDSDGPMWPNGWRKTT